MKNFTLLVASLIMVTACSPQAQNANAEKLTVNASEVKAKVQSAIDLGATKIAAAESNN